MQNFTKYTIAETQEHPISRFTAANHHLPDSRERLNSVTKNSRVVMAQYGSVSAKNLSGLTEKLSGTLIPTLP
ncbi:MAG: hypothetical protein V7L29_30225 [Nostoc sp.]|uniref:hypothetical protein n=1 Tax=Nostoc sp. TaxID=1180 RepID=UPI002FF970CD